MFPALSSTHPSLEQSGVSKCSYSARRNWTETKYSRPLYPPCSLSEAARCRAHSSEAGYGTCHRVLGRMPFSIARHCHLPWHISLGTLGIKQRFGTQSCRIPQLYGVWRQPLRIRASSSALKCFARCCSLGTTRFVRPVTASFAGPKLMISLSPDVFQQREGLDPACGWCSAPHATAWSSEVLRVGV